MGTTGSNFHQIYAYQICLAALNYQQLNIVGTRQKLPSRCPPYYCRETIEQFTKNSDLHKFNTRNKNKLAVPNFRLHKIGNSFMGKCIKLFNKLPQAVVELPIIKFKAHIKRTLMKKGYYKVDDYIKDNNAWDV